MTDDAASELQRGLATVADWLAVQTSGPLAYPERPVVRKIRDALVSEGVVAHADRRIKIPEWTADDLEVDLVIGEPTALTVLAEFKWSLTKLDHLLWDLVKMSNGAEREERPETFLVAGTSTENWEKGAAGCEFLASSRWDLEQELRSRPTLWGSLCRNSECCPTSVARVITTEALTPIPVEWGEGIIEIRLARVIPDHQARVEFDERGSPLS